MINSPWRADAIRRAVEGVQGALPDGAWASWVLGNHDQPRFASPARAGREQAKVGMLMLLTLRGTPTIYYGEEIGMVDVPVATADSQDPLERREPGRGRDPERSPMQWDASPNAGFTAPGVEPWLPLAPDAATVNVAGQAEDPDSILTLTRRLHRAASRAPGPPRRRLRGLRPDPGRHVRLPARLAARSADRRPQPDRRGPIGARRRARDAC